MLGETLYRHTLAHQQTIDQNQLHSLHLVSTRNSIDRVGTQRAQIEPPRKERPVSMGQSTTDHERRDYLYSACSKAHNGVGKKRFGQCKSNELRQVQSQQKFILTSSLPLNLQQILCLIESHKMQSILIQSKPDRSSVKSVALFLGPQTGSAFLRDQRVKPLFIFESA